MPSLGLWRTSRQWCQPGARRVPSAWGSRSGRHRGRGLGELVLHGELVAPATVEGEDRRALPMTIMRVRIRNCPCGPAAASRGVTSASAAAITRATEMIVPWAVERTSVVKDSWDHIRPAAFWWKATQSLSGPVVAIGQSPTRPEAVIVVTPTGRTRSVTPTARPSKRLGRAQRSGTYLARGAKQRPPDLAFPQVRGPLALVAGEGFEPSKLSRWIYSPLPLAARATCLVRMEG